MWARRDTDAGKTGAKLKADAPATRARARMDLRVGSGTAVSVSALRGRLKQTHRAWHQLRPREAAGAHQTRGDQRRGGIGRTVGGARRAITAPPLSRRTPLSRRPTRSDAPSARCAPRRARRAPRPRTGGHWSRHRGETDPPPHGAPDASPVPPARVHGHCTCASPGRGRVLRSGGREFLP